MVLLTLGVVSAEIIPAGDEHIEIKSKYRLNGGNWVEGSPIVNIDKNDEIELTVEVKVKKLWGKNNHRLSLLDLDRDSIGPDPLYTVIKEPDYVRGNVYTFCDDDNDDGIDSCEVGLTKKNITWKLKLYEAKAGEILEKSKQKFSRPCLITIVLEVDLFSSKTNEFKDEWYNDLDQKVASKTVFGAHVIEEGDTDYPGTGPGELNWPTHVHIGYDGKVYVADHGNYRIQAFNKDCSFDRMFGHVGYSEGFMDIALGKDNYFYTSRVNKFDSNGKHISRNDGIGHGGTDIEVIEDGQVYIYDSYNNRIAVLDKFDSEPRFIELEDTNDPGIRFDIDSEGRIYKEEGVFYPNGTRHKRVSLGAWDVKVMEDGKIYGLDYSGAKLGCDKIVVHDSNLNLIDEISIAGLAETPFERGPTFDMDSDGNFYIADVRNNRLVVFDNTGEFVCDTTSINQKKEKLPEEEQPEIPKEDEPENTSKLIPKPSEGLPWLWIGIGIAILVVIGIIVIALIFLKMKK